MFSNPIIRKIASGLGANVYGQIVTIVIQLISVPVYLSQWSVSQYGEWLLIFTLPMYLSIADGGVMAVAGTEVHRLVISGNRKQAVKVFQSGLLIALPMLLSFLLVGFVIVLILSERNLFNSDFRWAFLIMLLSTLLTLLGGAFETVFKSEDKYSLGVYIINTIRLVEWGAGIIFFVAWGSFEAVASGYLCGRLICTVLLFIYVKRKFHKISWGIKMAEKAVMLSLIRPSLQFLIFPFNNLISLQGGALVVNFIFGPAIMAKYSAYRTLSRILVQISTTTSRSIWPEVTRLHASRDFIGINFIRKNARKYLLLGMGAASLFLMLTGDLILEWWTGGKIQFDFWIFLVMVSASFLTAFWQTNMTILTALNIHGYLVKWILATNVMSLVLPFLLVRWFGEFAVVIPLLINEILMLSVFYKNMDNYLKSC